MRYNNGMEAKELIKYFKNTGLEVHTTTKARGHQGIYLKNRIDISKNLPQQRIIPTLLHEFAHHIHFQIEPTMGNTGGNLEIIFKDDKISDYKKELVSVTNFIDTQARCEKLRQHKNLIKTKIIEQEKIIKNKYPKFQRSKKFIEFDKYIKNSKAKYLLKHDRIKLISGIFFKKTEILTIDNIEKDFCNMPKEFAAYIRLKSYQKKQSKISAKINRLTKYYEKPTELFARFVEGLYTDSKTVRHLAPKTYARFFELLNSGYYSKLKDVINYFYNPVNL